MMLLGEIGCELHYINVADGSCGTSTMSADEAADVRAEEAQNAAALIDATWYPSIGRDMQVLYSVELLRKLTAVVRRVAPAIVLTQSPQDYMEDHTNTSRLAVSAAFARGMINFTSTPEVEPITDDVVLYHAMPHGLVDQLRNPIRAEIYVDVGSVIDCKRRMLACHASQKQWLDESQGFDSYLDTLVDLNRAVGRLSGSFEYAEGWRRHLHYGYSREEADPLGELLEDRCAQA